jgi:hypothetical protein
MGPGFDTLSSFNFKGIKIISGLSEKKASILWQKSQHFVGVPLSQQNFRVETLRFF